MKTLLTSLFFISSIAFACGENGSLNERIANCATSKTVKKHKWSLVQKLANEKEIWLDEESKILLSDTLAEKYMQFDAMKVCATVSKIDGASEWFLPQLNDYFDAHKHRYLQFFSKSAGQTWLWTATLDEGMPRYDAHAVSAISSPDLGVYSRERLFAVRCMARVAE